MTTVAIVKERLDRQGGLEKYARHLVTAFAQRGCRVTILTTEASSHHPAAEVVNLGKRAPLSVVNIRQFNQRVSRWLREHHYDVVFGMDRTTEQTHYRAGNGVHAAFLRQRSKDESWLRRLSFAINPLHRTILKYEREAFHNPRLRRLFVNSHMVRREVLDLYGIDESKISVVHNGVEWNEWQQHFDAWPDTRTAILHSLGLDPSCFQLLFIGHGFKRKGLHHLLRALALVKDTNIQLSVVGKDKDSAQFQHLADKMGIGANVKFFGARNDIVTFYQAADVLAVPSTYDPFANVTIEALAMGLYVVSSRHNGGSEVLTEATGCLIDDLEDPEAIVEAINTALKHPKKVDSAETIRLATRSYDFSERLSDIVDQTLCVENFTHTYHQHTP